MLRARANIRSANRPLQDRPEVLDGVRMNATVNVLLGVVDDPVNVVLKLEPVVRAKLVGIDRRALRNAFDDFRQERSLAIALNHPRPDLTAALTDAHDRGLAVSRPATFPQLCRVAVAPIYGTSLGPNPRFVSFDLTGQLLERPVGQCKADSMQDEPGRLLRYRKGAGKLARRDTVLVARNKPDRRQPFVKADGRVLKHRSDLHGKLPVAILAEPAAVLRQGMRLGVAATWARGTVRPAHTDEIVVRDLRVGKLTDRLKHGRRVGRSIRSHASILARRGSVCQIYNVAYT